MKRSLQTYSLLALSTMSLPFALAGCNSSTDSTMTSSATPPDTNMAAPAMTAPTMDTNTPATSAPAPTSDSTKPESTNTPGATTNSM